MLEQAFKKWVADTDTVILTCWDLGHIWDADMYDNIEKRPHGAFMLSATCNRGCGVHRDRYLTSSWQPDSSKNTYLYPAGYSPRGLKDFRASGFFMSAEHRAYIRKELARRAKEEVTSTGKSNVIHARAKFSG